MIPTRDLLDSLEGSDDEPCYLCGHTFEEHEFPQDPVERPYCAVSNCVAGQFHEWRPFNPRWGN